MTLQEKLAQLKALTSLPTWAQESFKSITAQVEETLNQVQVDAQVKAQQQQELKNKDVFIAKLQFENK